MGELTDDPFLAARLILTLRKEGITDPDVLRAVESVARTSFVDPSVADLAYENCVLPIGCGQTLERPSVVAAMLQALRLRDGPDNARVLIIGAGSGYTAALASELAGEVFAVERFRRLCDQAKRNLAAAAITNVRVWHGDGLAGWPDEAPFDRILLTGELDVVPDVLLAQLAPSGFCVVPLAGESGGELVCIDNLGDKRLDRMTVNHTPLRTGVSKAL